MSVQVMLFSAAMFLFMLLLMCCGSGGVVCAEKVNSVSQSNSVELFKKGETKVDGSGGVVSSFSAHSLVDVNGLMVALASARSDCGGSQSNIEIWSKSLKYEKDTMPSEIIKPKDGSQWMVQSATKKTNESYCTRLFGPSAVVKDNKIYILLSNYTTPKTPERDGSNAFLWDLELVVGTVETSTGGSPNTITWDPSKSLKDTLKGKLPDGSSWDELRVVFGKGIVMGGSTILFPLTLQKINPGVHREGGCTVIYSEDNGDNWNFPPGKIIDKDCRDATLLEWEGKLLMIPIPSSSSRTIKVHVSADKGKTWAEDGETGSSLLVDFLIRAAPVDENGMTTATINGKNVALISQPAISSGSGAHNQVHLFMTDNKRIASVGDISLDHDIRSHCKLFLTKENGELFALCNKGSRESQSVVLFSLTEQLERIKFVLKSWEITDGKVSKICISATKEASCSTMPTSGLIGFLSNTSDDAHWADEYLGVNATVSGGTKVENGFKLSGSGAKVEWRFGGQGQNQLYNFADLGLTLVATVTIHDIPESDTPLMSIGFASKAVGLLYAKENHWKGIIGEGEVATGNWEKDKPFQVAITVLNGTGSVYIGEKRLGTLLPNFRPNNDGKAPQPPGPGGMPHELKEEVRDICFGNCPFMHNGYESTAASSFTVTNVFLYNRVLSEAELPPPPPPPLQQSQTTAKETGEATTTGNSTDEERGDTTPQQEQEQSQTTAKETGEATITGNSTDEERGDTTPQQEQEQGQCIAKKTRETTITGNSTDEERGDTTPAGNDSSVHESLSSLFQLFALLVFLGSASL